MNQELLKMILDELNRITESSYPVSLRRLEILSDQNDGTAFRLWVNNYPCRASILVQKILDGLTYSTSALSVLEKLSRLEAFRCIVFEQNPSVLPLFLRRALDANYHNEQYSELCANLLSSSLDGIPLPNATERFLFKISNSAVQQPSVWNIARLHRVVRGSCRELLVAVPRQALQSLVERVIGIIKTTKATDGDSPILFCISILACLHQQCKIHSVQSDILLHVAGEFFHGQKATKTIQLILLRAIWACKESTIRPIEGAVGCLRLAREILETIDTNILSAWRNDHPQVSSKLVEKLSSRSHDTDILCEGAALLNMVIGGPVVPTHIIRNLEESILNPKLTVIMSEDGYRILRQVICDFIFSLEHDFHVGLLEKAFRFASEPASKDLHQFNYLLVLLEAVEISVQKNTDAALQVQKALMSKTVSPLLSTLLDEGREQQHSIECHDDKLCLTAFRESQQRLRRAIISLSLKSSLFVDNPSSKISAPIAQRLLQKQADINLPLLQCKELLKHTKSLPLSPITSDQIEPHASLQSRNWREQLARTFRLKAAEQANYTIEAVERLCEEFENRCESIEEPLREEQKKSSEAQNSVRRLEEQVKNLGIEATDRVLYLDGLEAERTELETRINNISTQNSALTGQNDELRRLLKEATDDKSRTLSSLQAEKEAMEFQYKAKTVASEAEIERLQADLNVVKSQNKNLKAQIEVDEENKNLIKKDIESLHSKISCCEEESKSLEKKVLETEESLSNTEKNRKELEDALKLAHADFSNTNEQHKLEASNSLLSIRSLKTDLEHAYEMKKTIEDDLNHSRQQIQRLESERNDALITLEKQETEMNDCKDMNENLLKEIQIKDDELAEGHELRAKLSALVGGGGKRLDITLLDRPEKSPSRRTLPTRTRSDACVDQTNSSGDVLKSFGSSGSSSRKSPTPKRMRKIFKVPTMKQPPFSPNNQPSRMKRNRRSEISRTPLTTASPGRYNLTSQTMEPSSPQEKGIVARNPFSPVRTVAKPSFVSRDSITVGNSSEDENIDTINRQPSGRGGSLMDLPTSP